jgi:hypothetical protein
MGGLGELSRRFYHPVNFRSQPVFVGLPSSSLTKEVIYGEHHAKATINPCGFVASNCEILLKFYIEALRTER